MGPGYLKNCLFTIISGYHIRSGRGGMSQVLSDIELHLASSMWPFLPWGPFCGTFLPSPPPSGNKINSILLNIPQVPKKQAMLLGLDRDGLQLV